jgi:hypothetical protein
LSAWPSIAIVIPYDDSDRWYRHRPGAWGAIRERLDRESRQPCKAIRAVQRQQPGDKQRAAKRVEVHISIQIDANAGM